MAALLTGQAIALLIMALALGMDAFSLSIGIGMRGIRLRDVLRISILVGVFHMLMAVGGVYTGQYMSLIFGHITTLIGGSLLILLGVHMLINAFKGGSSVLLDLSSKWGLFIFAMTVSMDAFSVGVSIGMFAVTELLLAVSLFGFFGGLMSLIGLLVGRKVEHLVGDYGEAFGGMILLIFGIQFVL